MISDELLNILACPKTKLPLKVADSMVLDALNKKIKKKECKTIGGVEITKEIKEALIEQTNKTVYIIDDNIPNLIYKEAVILS